MSKLSKARRAYPINEKSNLWRGGAACATLLKNRWMGHMAKLVDLLATYSMSSCGFEVSELRRAWSKEEKREVDEVLKRYGQYGLGDEAGGVSQ